jgi:hypothetical protein
MPEHSFPSVINVGPATLEDAVSPWRVGAAARADSGAAVPAAGAVNPLLNPLLIRIGALGSGKSTSFVVGGGEDR